MKTTITICSALLGLTTVAHADARKLSKAELTAATQIVWAAYKKEKFPAVRTKVEGKLGPAHKVATNMFSWFAKDGGKWFQLWITEGDQGYAAVGMSDSTDDAKSWGK